MLQCGGYLQLQTAAGQWNLLQLELHHASIPGRDLHRPTARHPASVLPPDPEDGLPPDEGLPPDDDDGLPPADEGLLVVICLLVVRSKKTNDPDLAGVVLLLVVAVVRGVVVVVVGAAAANIHDMMTQYCTVTTYSELLL